MRLLSVVQWHHFAYMIISLALLGYAASGTAIALARELILRRFALVFTASAWAFAVTLVVCLAFGQRVPFNALEVVWDRGQYLNIAVMYLVFFVPFFFAATCIGATFLRLGQRANRIYLFDLAGAGLGAIGILAILFLLPPAQAVKPLAALALAGAALAALSLQMALRLRAALVLLATAVLLMASLPEEWLELRISPYKGLSQTLEVVDTRILAERWSPLGLLTVVESPTIPFRHAPGLSLATRHVPPEQLAVYVDADSMTPITHFDGDFAELAYLDDLTSSLPYALLETPRVLVLGAGAGGDVLAALRHGARQVDAVELDRGLVDLVRGPYAEFAGRLYDRADVEIHIDEARGFVARSRQRYDLIQVSLLDSFAASGSGVQALGESYLYTVEAFRQFLEHTSSEGMLAVTRWLKVPPRDSLKLVTTARAALESRGVASPGAHIAMIRSWNTSTVLVKPEPFSPNEIRRVREFAASRSFDPVWYPGMTEGEANRLNVLPEAYLYRGANALLGGEAARFREHYKFDVTPASDDRPYFFHFFRWSVLPELLALRKQGGAGLIEWGYLILVATLAQAAVLGAAFILLPLAIMRGSAARAPGPRPGAYFFLLGLAFLFIEMAFIQRFILFLSHPLYAVAVVLAGFLIFAGLGSGASRWFVQRLGDTPRRAIRAAVVVLASVSFAYLLVLPAIFPPLMGLPDAAKVAISLLLIAPLAFFMGMPFPLGLGILARANEEYIPWAWGLNGFASVLSASLATLLAIEFGFTMVVVSAIVLYALAAITAPGGAR